MDKKTLVAKTVDEYLKRLPADQRKALEKVREIIKANAPMAEEKISYAMPGYFYHGHLIFFAAFKDHLSIFAVNKKIYTALEKELEPFRVTNSTLHFTVDNQLPAALLKKIVKTRVKENEALAASKLAPKSKAKPKVKPKSKAAAKK